MKNIVNFIMVILFGKDSLNGFYKPDDKPINKSYKFSSVFPNEEALEEFLNEKV